MESREVQLKYEQDSDTQAAAQHLQELQRSSLEGKVELPRAARFIARAYGAVKQALDDTLAVKTRGAGGKFKGWLRAVPSEVAAVIAIRECISQCMRSKEKSPVTVQTLASAIGRLYELEVRIKEAETVNPMYMQRIHEQVKEHATTDRQHLRKLYNVAYDRVMKGEMDSSLSNADSVHLGKFGVQACMDAGILIQHRSTGRKGNLVYFTLDEEVLEFLTDYTIGDTRFVVNTGAGAMKCPPDPWTNLQDGGYLSARRKLVYPLMKTHSIRKAERERVRKQFNEADMPTVFECANYLQAVPFGLHRPTLEAITRLWLGGGGVLGVPRKNAPVKPECPFPPEWVSAEGTPEELEVFKRWKREAGAYYDSMRQWRGRVRELSGFLKAAGNVSELMWFPVYMDTRNRWYYRGSPNPQGSDLSKAVLHFGTKKALGPRGVFWLQVHIANCFGFDKVRLAERARWTQDNWTVIAAALDSPEDHPDVWGTDAPWCMFAAAWELREALASGSPELYKTGIPIHMDATCSGLQHFSAMLRDPVGGRYVNLYDEDGVGPKQDIYSRVASNALRLMQLDSEDAQDEETAQIAAWWLKTGIPRGMAKKPVMTYVYGATLLGTIDYITDYVENEMGLQFPEGVRAFTYAQYCAKKLFGGIASTVPAAANAMRWLKDRAKEQPRGKRMEWTTPTGFKVQHDYQDYTEVRIKLLSCGMNQTIVREYNEDTIPSSMQNAISPNFVHALDAAHLTFTALAMRDRGLDIVTIHDSFGTHPCDVDTMHCCIREQFVNLYTEHDVLGSFLIDTDGVGETPMRGTLDLSRVLDSEYFFC